MKFNLFFILIIVNNLINAQVTGTPFIIKRPEPIVTSMTLSVSGTQIAYDFRIANAGSTPIECGFIYSYNTKYPNGDNDPNDEVFSITPPDNHNGVITGTTSISFLIAPYYFIPYVKNKHTTIYGSRVILAPNWPTVTLNGKTWAAANLGASRIATSNSDSQSWGFKYQWGRGSDGHQLPTSTPTSAGAFSSSDDPGHGNFILSTSGYGNWRNPANTSLWIGVNGTNNPCPSGWRLATKSEWEEVINDVASKPPSYQFNGSTAYSHSDLKIPRSQGRDRRTAIVELNNVANMHWFGEVILDNAANLMFSNGTDWRFDSGGEAYGGAVRCIQN
jgi:uncharacterized protein (TIGR02145 family)